MTLSRRSVLGGGAALLGAGAVAAVTDLRADSFQTALTPVELETLDIPVMLSVTDAASGEMEILVGEQAVPFNDRRLVAKLARVARGRAG